MLYTRDEIINIEDNSEKFGVDKITLMSNAGKAAFECISRRFCDTSTAVVVCGGGNNGGDGLVVAAHLMNAGIRTKVYLISLPKTDAAKLMYDSLCEIDLRVISTDFTYFADDVKNADIVVDAIFGSGFKGNVDERTAEIISNINSSNAKVVSLDLPSGVECDNGMIGNTCIKSDLTVSFIAKKLCHILYPGAEFCGEIECVDIGVPSEAYLTETLHIISENDVKRQFSNKRPILCNKYDFGRVTLACGSYGMAGAAKIAASAAVKCGAGLVGVCLPQSIYEIVSANLSEPVFYPLNENSHGHISANNKEMLLPIIKKSDAILVGCGLGCDEDTIGVVSQIVDNADCDIIIDADGINCVSENINIIKRAKSDLILTPHMGEMSRLIGLTIKEIQSDIIQIGRNFSSEYNAILVLKGPRTLIFEPNGNVYINTMSDSSMATAGTGDMLAGMITAFCGEGIRAIDAARYAVFLHGKSGVLSSQLYSQRATTPTTMIKCLEGLFLEYETNEGD